MKLAVTQFVTLDGVYQGPGSATEDTSDGFERGGWLVPYLDGVFVRQASDWLDLADGLLFGRRTYEAFARDWPQIPESDPFSVRMNTLPKYVITNTLSEASWNPTTILTGDAIAAVQQLKEQLGRELQVHGSGRLAASLLAGGIVDTLRLVVAPSIIGTGRRLLPESSATVGLQLAQHQVTSTGVLLLEYETAGAAPLEDFTGVPELV